MGHTPKDYDISTSARPEEIKKLFSNCLLIGRRFRLAHIRFGKKIIEVSTFRAGETDSELILRDNTWGSQEEDVVRRDFTINGLFYDANENKVIDYVGGCEDLSRHLLRTIGTPIVRFKQDPVRMIRLLKFRARFGFSIDPETWSALEVSKEEIRKSSPARLLEELFKMLESGASSSFFRLMSECGILELLMPRLDHFLQNENKDSVYDHLEVVDQHIRRNRHSIPPRAVLACSLFFPLLQEAIKERCKESLEPTFGEIVDMTHSLLREITSSSFTDFPRKIRASVNFLLNSQYRIAPISSKKPHRYRLMRHPEFPLALQFFQIRSEVQPELKEIYNSWKKSTIHRKKPKKAEPLPNEPQTQKNNPHPQ